MPSIHGPFRRDIQRCNEAIESGNIETIKQLLTEFETGYKMYWKDLHFRGPAGWVDKDIIIAEIKGFKTRLESLLRMSREELSNLMRPRTGPSIINQNSNNSSINIDITLEIQIQSAIDFIEDHPGMSDPEKEEAKNKITELKSISESGISKVKKWDKIKPILIWLSTRGLDLSLKIIPIILQILSMNQT